MSCSCTPCLPDYSKGYPPHIRHLQHDRSQTLVKAGYQDPVCIEEKVARLGINDHHKKGLFHPSINNSIPKARNVQTVRKTMC